MSDYIKREDAINAIMGQYCASSDETEFALGNAVKEIAELPAADVVDRDEGIRMGAELAAMHCSDATSKELEKAYLDGVEEGLRKARKTGKWNIFDSAHEYCSECGKIFSIDSLFMVGINNEPNFCPNCGADMRGDDDV